MKLRPERLRILVLAVSVLVISSAVGYALSQFFQVQESKGTASVIQDGGGQSSGLGQSIQELTQGIIGRTNEQVQNTLENAGRQALPQLPANASQYDCLIIVMNFGKAHGAMTCSPNQQFSNSITVNSGNAPGISSSSSAQATAQGSNSAQSSIQRQGGSTMMQNQIQGSGSSANVIPGDVP